ncbi:DUF5431 family protein [Cronobacter sakazakii]
MGKHSWWFLKSTESHSGSLKRQRKIRPALEAFCLRQSAKLPLWRMAERRKPRRSIFINQRGCLHTEHMQISLLPVARQGKEADETTAKCAYLVRINRL